MRTTLRTITATMLLALAAGCGGSGSTGLVEPEILDEVRRDGTCVTSHESVTYCATDSPDAVAPGGASAEGPLDNNGANPTPARTATPGPGGVTPSPAPSAQPTAAGPSGTPTPGGAGPTPTAFVPTAAPTSTPTPAVTPSLQFVVRGLPEGAACALAARADGSDAPWLIGALVPAGGAEETVDAPLPGGAPSGALEVALLCYETRPDALPTDVADLADASPDVVFAPAEPVTVARVALVRRRVG